MSYTEGRNQSGGTTKVKKRKLTFVLEHACAHTQNYTLSKQGGENGQGKTTSSTDLHTLKSDVSSHHCSAVNSVILQPSGLRTAGAVGNSSSKNDRPQQRGLYTASRDATIKRWDVGGKHPKPVLEATFEGHVDWVNDIAVVDETLISASNDCTVRLWRADPNSAGSKATPTTYGARAILHDHSDYVMTVVGAAEAKTFVTGGLRSEIKLWDLEKAKRTIDISNGSDNRQRKSRSSEAPRPLNFECASENPSSSVYSMDINPSGIVLASGSTDSVVRIWDTRCSGSSSSGSPEDKGINPHMFLRGHSGNIRAVALNRAGTMCITGASDKSIRIWDLGQQRCVHTFTAHSDSVWALVFDEANGNIISGGRDGAVYCTSLSSQISTLLFEEEKPILSLAVVSSKSKNQHGNSHYQSVDSIWSTTDDSSIHFWDIQNSSGNEDRAKEREHRRSSFVASTSPFTQIKQTSSTKQKTKVVPLQKVPTLSIPGIAPLIKHEVLNDRQGILTEDSSGNICLWNVFTGSIEKTFEKSEDTTFQSVLESINPQVAVPSWFTVDKRLGKLAIHMEVKQCFSAEIYAVDIGLVEANDELKFNIGQQILDSLFKTWKERQEEKTRDKNMRQKSSEEDASSTPTKNSNKSIQWPFSFENNPCIITTTADGQSWRCRINDLDGSEDESLIPEWVVSCVLDGGLPSGLDLKFSFHLLPADGSNLPSLQQGKLLAPRILHIGKVLNYIATKLVEQMDDENYKILFGDSGQGSKKIVGSDLELVCNGKLLTPGISLITVRQYIWKRSDDIIFHYQKKTTL